MNAEEIKSYSIEQVEKRMEEIRSMDLDKVENIDEISKEVDALQERRKALKDEAKAKKELRTKILNGEVETTVIEKPQEERKMKLTAENYRSSAEYRSAFMKNLMGKELNVEERAAIALAGADPVIPEYTQNEILKKIREYAPVLNDITLLTVNGHVKFAVEGTVNNAEIHTENKAITPASDALVTVELSTYEIVKLIQISASVKSMTIAAFETWLVDTLVEAVSMKVENLIFNGTGSSQAKGVNSIDWDSTNSVTVAKDSKLTTADVYKLFGMMKERNAKAYMSRLTLFGDFLPLQDNSKNNLVTLNGGNYYILGTKVEFTDSMLDHEVVLGNFKKYVGNLAEAIGVKTSYDINSNSYKYLGVCQFDGKPAVKEAFVKLLKATV